MELKTLDVSTLEENLIKCRSLYFIKTSFTQLAFSKSRCALMLPWEPTTQPGASFSTLFGITRAEEPPTQRPVQPTVLLVTATKKRRSGQAPGDVALCPWSSLSSPKLRWPRSFLRVQSGSLFSPPADGESHVAPEV